MKTWFLVSLKRLIKGLLFENNEVSRTSVMMVSSLVLAWMFYGWATAHPEHAIAVQVINSCTTIITGIVSVKIGQMAVRETINGVFNSPRGQMPENIPRNPNINRGEPING